jgi:hypothetical protein
MKYKVGKSSIQGKGLIVKEPFKEGELIGLAHINNQPTKVVGLHHNHSDEPTAGNIEVGNKRYLVALRNLKPGEEITTNYREQPELEQPEDFEKKKGGAVSLPKDKPEKSKKFSRSLDATNRLFTENNLFKRPKSRKNKVFDPNAKYYKKGGALLTKKVTCKKCGWSWDAADGGDDITTCHKCGGQGLIHAQGGGVTKTKLSDKEEKTFQKFYNTLPNNLQSDDDTYDIRGYWDSEGRPEEFNYDQPKDKDDGYYHAYSINSNTGEYLKSPAHETFQHAVDEDRKMGYRPVTNVQGRNIATENESLIEPEAQSFLRNMTGPASYKKGGTYYDDSRDAWVGEDGTVGPNGPATYAKGGESKCPPGQIKVNGKCTKVEPFVTSDKKEYAYRKKAYNDSLTDYNWTRNQLKKYETTGKSNKGRPINVSSKVFKTPSQYIDEKYKDLNANGINVSKKEVEKDFKSMSINGQPVGVNTYQYKNQKGKAAILVYKKPVQPVVLSNKTKEETKKAIPTTRTIYINCPPGSVPNGQTTDVTEFDPQSPGNYLRTITTFCDPVKEEKVIPSEEIKTTTQPIITTQEVEPMDSTDTYDYSTDSKGSELYWDRNWHSFKTPRLNHHFPLGPLFNGKKKHNFSTPVLRRREVEEFSNGGESGCPDNMIWDEATQSCVSANETTTEEVGFDPIDMWAEDYEQKNPRGSYVYDKKQEYLKKTNRGLSKLAGITLDNFPKEVEDQINEKYNYNMNGYITDRMAKVKKFNPNKHDEWVDELGDRSKEVVANSKYGSKLQPSLWARSLAGLATLTSPFSPDLQAEVKASLPGLTKRETNEIYNAKYKGIPLGGLETFSAADIPGAVVANYLKNSKKDNPNVFSGELMSNVDAVDAMAMNPMGVIGGIESLAALGTKGISLLTLTADALKPGAKGLSKFVGTESGVLSSSPNVSAVTEPFEIVKKRIVNSSDNINRIIRKPEPVAKPNYGQQEFAFPTDAPMPSARLSNEEQMIEGMERARLAKNEEGTVLNPSVSIDKPHKVNSPDYYLDIMKMNKYNGKNKQYFIDLVESVKRQGNVASEKQFDELQRIKSGDYSRGKKGYAEGGATLDLTEDEINAYKEGGWVVEYVD